METSVKSTHLNFYIAAVLILFGLLLRIGPHPANFAPITAIALFGGAVLPKKYAVVTPLIAMVLSDVIIGLHSLIPVTWGCYILIALVASAYLQKRTFTRVSTSIVSASAFFFIVTNAAVWQFSGMYAHTFDGLVRCFTLALPFFRNTILSDILYGTAFFGVCALANKYVKHNENMSTAAY